MHVHVPIVTIITCTLCTFVHACMCMYIVYRMVYIHVQHVHVIMSCMSIHLSACAGRYHSKQIYEQEMKRGHFELVVDKVVMYGMW